MQPTDHRSLLVTPRPPGIRLCAHRPAEWVPKPAYRGPAGMHVVRPTTDWRAQRVVTRLQGRARQCARLPSRIGLPLTMVSRRAPDHGTEEEDAISNSTRRVA